MKKENYTNNGSKFEKREAKTKRGKRMGERRQRKRRRGRVRGGGAGVGTDSS